MNIEIPGVTKTVRISEVEAMIVGYLYEFGETHAYAIATGLDKPGLHDCIYVYLNRLQKKGVIDSKVVIRKRNGVRVPHRVVKLRPLIRRSYNDAKRSMEDKTSNLVRA